MGQDVNNKNHGKLTQYQAKTFALLLGFTIEDIDLMEKAGVSHDFGESRTKDVLFDYKNSDVDHQEFEAYLEIMQELARKDDRGIITPVLIYTIAEIIYKLEGQEPSKLHEAFNVIERLGYLRTGLVAWKRLKQTRVINSKIGELPFGLSWLTHNVLLNQVPTLINDLSKYPVISKYLLEMAPLVAEAFESAKLKWQEWLSSQTISDEIKTRQQFFITC